MTIEKKAAGLRTRATSKSEPQALILPDVARGIIKALIVSLGNAGLITGADSEYLIAFLRQEDA